MQVVHIIINNTYYTQRERENHIMQTLTTSSHQHFLFRAAAQEELVNCTSRGFFLPLSLSRSSSGQRREEAIILEITCVSLS